MDHRLTGKMTGGFALSLLLCLLLAAGPRAAAAQQTGLEPCDGVVGTYVVSITDIEGVFASRQIVSFLPGGIYLVRGSGAQRRFPGVFEPFPIGQGVWKCAADGSDGIGIDAMVLAFTRPQAERRRGFARADYKVSFDPAANSISARITLRLTAEGDIEAADPIDSPGPVIEEFGLQGERVVLP